MTRRAGMSKRAHRRGSPDDRRDGGRGSAAGQAARRQIRLAAAVILATGLIWVAASWAGGRLGLPPRYAFLFDFAALGAFSWSLVVLVRNWNGSTAGGDG